MTLNEFNVTILLMSDQKFEKWYLDNGTLLLLWYKSTTILSLKSVYHKANSPSPNILVYTH